MSEQDTTEMTAEQLHELADSLTEGDRVLVNERTRRLTVTGRHRKPSTKVYSPDDHYKIVELSGNGTEYHLLWMDGSVKPMLYKEAHWEITVDAHGDQQYEYPRSGDRVQFLDVERAED